MPYSVSFLNVLTDVRVIGYVYADMPDESSYTPLLKFQFNASGAPNTIRHFATGYYEISMPGLAGRGTAVVTPFADVAVACRVHKLFRTDGKIFFGVGCRDHNGAAVDSQFSALYLSGAGIKGGGGKPWAYLFAHKSKNPSYTPRKSNRAQKPKGRPHIVRARRGVYTVTLPKMPLGAAVHVSAGGTLGRKTRCHASAIRKSGKPQRIGVRCFSRDGRKPADAVFYLSYAKWTECTEGSSLQVASAAVGLNGLLA